MTSTARSSIALSLSAVMLAATACSSGTGASSGDGGGLRISAVATDRAGIEAVIKAFKQQNPGVEITTAYADTDQYQGTLRTQLSSGTAPDVFFAWPGNGNPGAIEVLAPTGYIADLSGRSWTSKIPSGIKPVTQVGGKTYIVPLTFVGIGAIYNEKVMQEVGAEVGLFPVPATDNPDETRMPGAAGGAFAMNAEAENPDLASKFIDFLATPEAMNLYAEATGNLPSIPNDQFQADPALQSLIDFQKAGKTVPFMDQLWPNPKVQQAHFTGVQEMFAGEADPASVLKQMDAAYKEK